ncbi:5352_t:CDS:2 [Ambispora gerdemannii]|uniref:5352_t:CDS:1 n=1 Tax=Ambispora gerdemannii TaxID=144530 RepID=A0A9N9F5N4_9GLOM|nr:5352_t:CDS:2 [Ambispora gerdemannii]
MNTVCNALSAFPISHIFNTNESINETKSKSISAYKWFTYPPHPVLRAKLSESRKNIMKFPDLKVIVVSYITALSRWLLISLFWLALIFFVSALGNKIAVQIKEISAFGKVDVDGSSLKWSNLVEDFRYSISSINTGSHESIPYAYDSNFLLKITVAW